MLQGVGEYERIARDALVELHTDPFLRRKDSIHLLRWALRPQERVGLFFVLKNSKIMLLLDARRTNQMFCQPPGVAVATAETLSRTEVRLPDGVTARITEAIRFFEERVARLATVDVDKCFRLLRIGQYLAAWFCMEPVRALDVSSTGREVSGQTIGEDEWIYPYPGRCPWVFSWFPNFAQSVTEHALFMKWREYKMCRSGKTAHNHVSLTSHIRSKSSGMSVSTTLVCSFWVSAPCARRTQITVRCGGFADP